MPTFKRIPYSGPRPMDQAFSMLAQGFINKGQQNREERLLKERDTREDAQRAEQMMIAHKLLQEDREYQKGLTEQGWGRQDLLRQLQETRQDIGKAAEWKREDVQTAEDRAWKERTGEQEGARADWRAIAPSLFSAGAIEFSNEPLVSPDMAGYKYMPSLGTNVKMSTPYSNAVTTPEGFRIKDIGDYNTWLNTQKSEKALRGEMTPEDFRGFGQSILSNILVGARDSNVSYLLSQGINPATRAPFSTPEEAQQAKMTYDQSLTSDAVTQAYQAMMGMYGLMTGKSGTTTKAKRTGGKSGEIYVFRKSDGRGGWLPEVEFDESIYEKE